MNLTRLILSSLLPVLFMLPGSLYGQQDGFTSGLAQSSADMVNIEVKRSQNLLPAGTSMQGAVLLNLEEGWHVNSSNPSIDFLIGTRLNFHDSDGVQISGIRYPPVKQYRFDFAEQPVDVFEGEAPLFFTLSAAEDATSGSYELTADLRIQACNNEVCLAPETVELHIPVEISAAGTGYRPLDRNLFAGEEARRGSITDALAASGSSEIEALFDTLGFFWAFAGIFLIGLALNLTPCVYPMLSVTVSLFGSREYSGPEMDAGQLSHSFFMAFVYVSGIVAMYSLLGVAAAYTGALFGSWMQSPLVLAGIGLLILALALSMFGFYELQPPSSWVQSLSGAQRKTGGIFGHFFSGLVVGVFAAPCIGPPIIALLAFVGAQGDPFFGFSIFFVMAFGLGFPYLILGTFGSLLSRLPKSGTWMVWVKKVFGVVLVGVALFYLALAFHPGYSIHIIIITLLSGGVYLGFIERSGRGNKAFTRVKWIVGAAVMIPGFMLIQNLQKPGISWETYTEQDLQEAIETGTPVMIDFYADWCIPCLELERSTFTNPEVIAVTRDFKRLKADLTQYESAGSEQLRQQYKIAGVPTILFINKDGDEVDEARVVGFLPANAFLERVQMIRQDEVHRAE